MKKLIVLLLSVLCILSGVSYIFAQENLTNTVTKQTVEYFEDGSYIVTEIIENGNDLARTYKTGTKISKYHNSSGKLVWKYELTGTFSYTGTSSYCTSTSSKVTYAIDGWKENSKTSYASGASAVGKVTMKHNSGLTRSDTVVLTCSPSGVLS